MRKILHEYGEPIQAEIQVYAWEEIVAETLRAILQHARKLEERGWSRSRSRDYYDLWLMFGTYGNQLDWADFNVLLREKCAVRSVTFQSTEDFFSGQMLEHVERTWDQWLGPLVPELPSFETVISELRPQITALIS